MTDAAFRQSADREPPWLDGDIPFARYQPQLIRIVRVRIDPRLSGRLDPDDVVQEAFLDAWNRRGDFDPDKGTLLVWLRFIVLQKLTELHRRHFNVQARNVRREVPAAVLASADDSGASSIMLASVLIGRLTTPSVTLHRAELVQQVQQTISQLSSNDREILLMRHFEQLSNADVAETLKISTTAACNRYVRALERMQKLLSDFPELDLL